MPDEEVNQIIKKTCYYCLDVDDCIDSCYMDICDDFKPDSEWKEIESLYERAGHYDRIQEMQIKADEALASKPKVHPHYDWETY